MLKKYFNRKSFLFKYISVLFVVMLIPTVFGYIISEISVKTALDEIKSKNYQSLTHIQKSMDSRLTEIMHAAIEISSSEELAAFAADPNAFSAYDIHSVDFVPQTAKVHDFVTDVIIYNKERDIIIDSNSSMYTVDQYCSNVLKLGGDEKADFRNWLDTPAFSSLYPSLDVRYYNRRVSVPIMLQAQSYPFDGDFKGNIVFMLNTDKMIADFSDKFKSDGTAMCLFDENGEILLSIGDEKYISEHFYEKPEGYGDERFNGEKVTYSVRNSSFGAYKYVVAESAASVQASIAPARLAIYLYILFILIFGVIVIFFLAKRNAKPVQELSDVLIKEGQEKKSDNEIEHIQSAIRNILSEKARMAPIIQKSQSTLRKNLISDILHGNFLSVRQIDEACRRVHISFSSDNFCVIYFALDGVSADDIPIIKYAISNISDELFAHMGEALADDSERSSAAEIINISETKLDTEQEILTILSFISDFFKENFDADIKIGLSNILVGVDRISVSYANAKEAAEYCAITGTESVAAYSQIKNDDYRYFYPLEVEDKLNSAVINGDMETVRELIDQIVSANSSLSLDMSRCLFFDLTATALKVMSNKAINLSFVFGEDESPFEELMRCKSISELAETIHSIFERICSQITENHDIKKEKLKIAIIDYIKNNYKNQNMSLSLIADEFAMNYTYMSHFFKDIIGKNFVDYISELRVAKAIELLRTTDLPVNDVAAEVGYSNSTVLIKTFKKVTKTTPGSYRKNTKE